jgi:hypothetical protein
VATHHSHPPGPIIFVFGYQLNLDWDFANSLHINNSEKYRFEIQQDGTLGNPKLIGASEFYINFIMIVV